MMYVCVITNQTVLNTGQDYEKKIYNIYYFQYTNLLFEEALWESKVV